MYNAPQTRRVNGATIALTNPLTANQQQNVMYLTFQVTVFPSRANPLLSLGPRSTQAMILLPRTPDNASIRPDLTFVHLNDVITLMTLFQLRRLYLSSVS